MKLFNNDKPTFDDVLQNKLAARILTDREKDLIQRYTAGDISRSEHIEFEHLFNKLKNL